MKNGIKGWLAALFMAGSFTAASAAYDPCDPCDFSGFKVYADFLYWQVHPEGTEFVRQLGVGSTTTTTADEGKVFSAGCDFQPGFRIGGIQDLECCDWDAFVQYTFLVERLTNNVSVSQGTSGLTPLIYNLGGVSDVDLAKGDWHSDFNSLDLGMGRTFEINCCYSFRPFFGIKATWQKYNFDVTYERIVSTTLTNRDRLQFHSEFDGIGLRGGFDAAWKFCPWIQFVGTMAFSTLYSDWHATRIDWRYPVESGVEGVGTKNTCLKNYSCLLAPVVELQAGIQFETEFYCDYKALLMVGYETQIWWGINRMIYFGDSTNNNNFSHTSGNLTFQGLVLRGGLVY